MPNTLETQPQTPLAKRSRRSPASLRRKEMLIDVARLEKEYFERKPDVHDPNQLVSFGTSGHRGSPLHGTLQRSAHSGDHAGDLRIPAQGRQSTALSIWARTRTRVSAPAQRTALEVLAANGVETIIQRE